MNYREVVLNEISKKGYIFRHNFDENINQAILDLQKEGSIEPLTYIGLPSSFGEYYYTYIGNPYNVRPVNCGGGHFEVKSGV